MNIKKITFILSTFISYTLFADIFDVFSNSDDPAAQTVASAGIKKEDLKLAQDILAQSMPLELQTPIAQILLNSSFDGKAKFTGKKTIKTFGLQRPIISIAWSPDSTRLAYFTGSAFNPVDINGGILDIATGKIHMFPFPTCGYISVAWSHDGSKLALGGHDNTIRIWDIATGQINSLHRYNNWSIYSLAWNNDGTKLAAGSSYGPVRIRNTTTGLEINKLGKKSSVDSLAWSPDNKLLISSESTSNTVKVWDIETEKNIHTVELDFDIRTASAKAIAWTPEGITLASVKTNKPSLKYLPTGIDIWDVLSKQKLHTLPQYIVGNIVKSLAWSVDGIQLASGSKDGTITIWSFPRPILTPKEWKELSIEQAFFLILLYRLRPTLNSVKSNEQLFLGKLHKKLTLDEAQRIWDGFSKETQERIKHRYAIIDPIDEIRILRAERQLKMQYEHEARQLRRASEQSEQVAQEMQEEQELCAEDPL